MKLKKVRPLFTGIITTMDTYDAPVINAAGIIDTTKREGAVKEFQRVIAAGEAVKEFKPGDMVCINPSRYAVRKYEENSIKNDLNQMNPITRFIFKTVELEDYGECLLLDARDVMYVIEETTEEASE